MKGVTAQNALECFGGTFEKSVMFDCIESVFGTRGDKTAIHSEVGRNKTLVASDY